MAAQPVLTPEQIAALNALVGTPAAEPRGMDFTAEMAEETPRGMDFTEETASTQGPLPLVNPWQGEPAQRERQLPGSGASGIPGAGSSRPLPGEGIRGMDPYTEAPAEMPLPGRQAQSLEPMDARPELNPSEEVGAFRAAQGMPQQSGQMTGEQAAQMAAAPRQEPNQPPTVNTQPLEPDAQTASVAEFHARPPEVASSAAESPGATTTEMRAELDRAVEEPPPQQAKGGAPSPEADVFTRLKQVTEAQPSEELETAQRRTAILRAMQGILTAGGAAAGMSSNPMAQRVGAGMQMGAAAAIPTDQPMANYEQEVGERELAREGILDEATAGNARAQAVNQRMAMENAQDRTQLQREAQEFGMEGVATERAYQEGQRSTTGQPADDIRERIRGLSSGVNRENRPDFPSEQEIERVLGAGSPEELNELETTLNTMIRGTAPRVRRGRGGGGGGRSPAEGAVPAINAPFNEREAGLIQEWQDLGLGTAGQAEQRIRDARASGAGNRYDRYSQRLEQFEQAFESGRTRLDPMRREMAALTSNQREVGDMARLVAALDDDQITWLQRSAGNQTAASSGGGGYMSQGLRIGGQAGINAVSGLSPEDIQEAELAKAAYDRVVDMAARAESGAAINSAEWLRFYARVGGDWLQSPETFKARVAHLAAEHDARFTEWRGAHPMPQRSRMTEGDTGDGPAPIMVEFVNRGPNGEIVIVDTVPRGSDRWRELRGTTDGHRTLEGE